MREVIFSGFENETRETLRFVNVERNEIYEGSVGRYHDEVWVLEKENKEMKSRFWEHKHVIEAINEMKKELGNTERENEVFKEKMCQLWGATWKFKVKNDSEKNGWSL